MHKAVEAKGLGYWDIIELAAYLTGNTDKYENGGIDDDGIEEAFFEIYEIYLEDLLTITRVLLPLAGSDISPLSNKLRRGFIDDDTGSYIIKATLEENGKSESHMYGDEEEISVEDVLKRIK